MAQGSPMTRLGGRARIGGLAVLALALLFGVACGGGDDSNEAGRLTVNGRAEVGAPGEDVTEVRGAETVELAERVNVREGTAVIELSGADDRQIELRAGSDVEFGVVSESDRAVRPALLAGDVLAVTGSSDLTVSVGDVGVVVRGAAQVSRGHSVVVSTYTGSADVTVAGQTLTVPALRQAVVPASGPVPAAPTPVVYDAGDTWDLRYLGDAIALGNELDARSQGFSAQLGPTDGRTADFFRRLLDPLAQQPSFTDGSLEGERPAGETLVGAAIAVEGSMGTFEERWTEVFAFRDQGASWGLVALDQGVTRAPLVVVVDGAIGRGPSLIAPPSGSGGGGGIALPATPSGGNGSGSSSGDGSGDAGQSSTPPADSPTTTAPPGGGSSLPRKGPLNTGIGPIDDLVNALVDTLSGLLRGLGGG